MALTHFFNNQNGNSLFEKIQGIANDMPNFDRFLAVVGFFRSSGYFKLRKELKGNDNKDVKEIKILIGINIDDIFRKHNQALEFLGDAEKAKTIYQQDFIDDILNAKYTKEVEEGLVQLLEDMKNGILEMRIHKSKNLHAKFYLCLPENHTPHSGGNVIMGSSNISDSGLGLTQPPRYELNVSMTEYDDVNYCHEEFKKLWNEGIALTIDDIDKAKKMTYLGYQPTPYEIYMKMLIESLGELAEDELDMDMPEGVMELKYQTDAVIQGYQMLLQHNGFILADVVGLGKTMIATMIAKRYIEANGKYTKVLVVSPPAIKDNWLETFEQFGISEYMYHVTNGSLDKILDRNSNYLPKEEFDLVIVDEAHGFRNDQASRYDELQKICKSKCKNRGLLNSSDKRIMLLSATPLNNRPEDLMNLLMLFQDSNGCTIEGIPNLKNYFAPIIHEYKVLIREMKEGTRPLHEIRKDVDELYTRLRVEVLDKITVRRTRHNIQHNPDYAEDVKAQGIKFPDIKKPKAVKYDLDFATAALLFETLDIISEKTSKNKISYARYRAIEFIREDIQKEKFGNAVHKAHNLADIYRTHMVKRLESSFFAFKKSLKTLLAITKDMVKMFEEDKVLIAPDFNVKDLMIEGLELDEIIERIMSKGVDKKDFVFQSSDFNPVFIDMLKDDVVKLEALNAKWSEVDKDPKFDKFIECLDKELLKQKINPESKLVLFSESVDTLNYIYDRLTNEFGRTDVLKVSAANRNSLKGIIRENFDANLKTGRKDDYKIIITSDVLAEGVNLHRSNVIVNYDSPWNATRLMQRIGRVNRIGSVADYIYNYMFYPSKQGENIIDIYSRTLLKLQGFHSAFGEDSQIYTEEEVVKQFEMFNKDITDDIDKRIELLREVRDLFNNDNEWYNKIKALPLKSRVLRETGEYSGKTIVFVSSNVKRDYYLSDGTNIEEIGFIKAAEMMKAEKDEPAVVPFLNEESHFESVNAVTKRFIESYIKATNTVKAIRTDITRKDQQAINFLNRVARYCADDIIDKYCDILIEIIEEGRYTLLSREVIKLQNKYKDNRLMIVDNKHAVQDRLTTLVADYNDADIADVSENIDPGVPQIIVSESYK